MLHGMECLEVKQESKISIVEMRILGWMLEILERGDRIRNGSIVEKIVESRFNHLGVLGIYEENSIVDYVV